MQNFNYHRPNTLAEAAKLSAQPDASLLAGGQSLIREMKLDRAAPRELVDLGLLKELRAIRVDGNTVIVGATATHDEVASSADVQRVFPALAALAQGIGDPQVRNRGTLGGAIATNDPAFDYPAAIVALNATVHTNTRTIPADAFFTGKLRTSLAAGEIITSVSFPIPEKAAYTKLPNFALSGAIVGVMVAKTKDGVRVAVVGAGPSVFRAQEIERALSAKFEAVALDSVKLPATGLIGDVFGTSEYRAAMVTVMAKRAVAACG